MTTSRLLILGASGDLTGRYLLRALAELVDHGRLPGGVEIIGVAREPWDTEQSATTQSTALTTMLPI